MYRKQEQNPISPENFEFPFSGKLSSDNRWIILANLIPWAEFEEEYSSGFSV
ncbi:MAG: IS5/IS1182 family transposase, partial [Nostoc sp.]